MKKEKLVGLVDNSGFIRFKLKTNFKTLDILDKLFHIIPDEEVRLTKKQFKTKFPLDYNYDLPKWIGSIIFTKKYIFFTILKKRKYQQIKQDLLKNFEFKAVKKKVIKSKK